MNYLGIDYGEKRIGLAISSKGSNLATPFKTLENKGDDALADIKKIVEEEKIDEVVVGLPVSFAMKDSEQTILVKEFAKKLQAHINMPVFFENEIFSTKVAKKTTKKAKVDQSAAALILQSYLDRKKTHEDIKYSIIKEDGGE